MRGRTILITGTEGWAIDQVEGALRRRGDEVLQCHEPDGPTFPCVGLAGGTCPLDRGVEVVLDVRARPLPQPTRREAVVTCGLREGVPLVVAGSTVLNPFAGHTATAVEGLDGDDIHAACGDAARRARPEPPHLHAV